MTRNASQSLPAIPGVQQREADRWATVAREIDRHCVRKEPYQDFVLDAMGGGRLRFARAAGAIEVQVAYERGWLEQAWLEAKAAMDRSANAGSELG